MKISTYKETNTTTDADGNIKTSSLEKTTKVEQSNEPDYVKIYTQMWCEFNRIPDAWRPLFLELVMAMSYANSTDPLHSQTVCTYGTLGDAIRQKFGWSKQSKRLEHGLRALIDCGAIRRVGRSVFQINPSYAGRGKWKYDPRLKSGGIEDLVATFSFKNRTVDTKIVWGDDGTDTPENSEFRAGIEAKPQDAAVLKKTTIAQEQNSKNDDKIPELAGIM